MGDLKICKFCIHATLAVLKYLACKATWPSLVMVKPFLKALTLTIIWKYLFHKQSKILMLTFKSLTIQGKKNTENVYWIHSKANKKQLKVNKTNPKLVFNLTLEVLRDANWRTSVLAVLNVVTCWCHPSLRATRASQDTAQIPPGQHCCSTHNGGQDP